MTSERIKGEIPIVTSLASFHVLYTGSSITVGLPALGAEFGLYAVMPGWISAAIFILPLGRFADIIGQKRIFFWGLPSSVSLDLQEG
jgi:MFS family permease